MIMELRYWVVLTFLGAIWGSAFIFIKIAAPEFGAIGLVQMRLLIASSVFVPILLRKKYIQLLSFIFEYGLKLIAKESVQPYNG